MPDAFDPYYEWLGIPLREQPVNFYKLLGLNLYETNSQVIANAADWQMTYIRMFQNGDHAKESQIILNEIAKARVTLLNEASKRQYDNNLKRQAFRGELLSLAPPVRSMPPASVANGFVPVLPETESSSNSTVQILDAVFETERLHRKTKNRGNDAAKKAKRRRILTAGSAGSYILVLLAIFILSNSISWSSSTPNAPSARAGELADTSQETNPTIEEPSIVAGDRMVKTVNGVEFAFRWCPPGTFTMGSPEDEELRENDETLHEVTFCKGFWLLETEVTQKQWQAIMGYNPSCFRDDNLPVEQVSWNDSQDFCKKFNSLSGLKIDLPTESQWEYACRAGTTGVYAGDIDSMAWYSDNSSNKSHLVGTKQSNEWGLSDMCGNVYEWCLETEGDYPSGSVTDPMDVHSGSNRINRGGSWLYGVIYCRSANRHADLPNYRYCDLGFRVSLGQ